jgi:hypothetical protein
MLSPNQAFFFAGLILFGLSAAGAQTQRGTTITHNAVPRPFMDGGVATVPNGQSTILFDGMVPPNGYMIRVYAVTYGFGGTNCFVNDNGPAGQGVGFYLVGDVGNNAFTSGTFTSPHGYKPMGPVSIWCQNRPNPTPALLAARAW